MELNKLEYQNEYDVEVLSKLPEGGANCIFRYEKEETKTKKVDGLRLEIPSNLVDWLILKVIPRNGNSWIGLFEPGVEGASGLFASPCKSVLCVVVKGQGYWVDVNSVKDYQIISSFPIKEVLAIPRNNMMVFVDYTKMVAYGIAGYLWKTKRLSWDGLKIVRITSTEIYGLAWDAPEEREVEFSITVVSGYSSGGASP